MADGSTEDRAGLKQMDDLTFPATASGLGDTKKYCEQSVDGDKVKLSFYTELENNSCEKSDASGVVGCSKASVYKDFQKPPDSVAENAEDRKKRCYDRYDSSESSDSGVVVLSPTESSGSSGSDITEPASPESACSSTEEAAGVRMPPWASEPAPLPAARRLPTQPAPTRPSPLLHRRITEYFNHKMKPQNGIKRDSSAISNDDTKRKCLPKNGVTHDLEKYISYLSQTLSPKLLDIGKQPDSTSLNTVHSTFNGVVDSTKTVDTNKSLPIANGALDNDKFKNTKDKTHVTKNATKNVMFMDFRHENESKQSSQTMNGVVEGKKLDSKIDPSAYGVFNSKHKPENLKKKVPIPASSDKFGSRVTPSPSIQGVQNITSLPKHDLTKVNGVVSSTTKLDSRMNGVTCGSNNISLNPVSSKQLQVKKEPIKKTMQNTKRTNRKSSACIANSKNMTWSKANNLKQQVQLQKQLNCVNNASQSQQTPVQNMPGEANTAPKMNIPNGVRQVSMTLNGNLSNLNVPATNFQNCHQLNIPSPYNGTVTSTNLGSFVAMPQNVMLTTLRIPQNGIPAQTLNQQSNLGAYKPNVNVNSPTKLNGQFVFPLMQNINGAVVQIPNLMAKMPNFVLPQPTLAQRQDHLQNQTQFLINTGTLLKLSSTMPSPYGNSNVNLQHNKSTVPNQSLPVMNKNVPGVQQMGVPMQAKPNYTVNLSHPMLMPQPGYIVTSVPNVNVKETWSYTMNSNCATSSHPAACNPMEQHPSPVANSFTAQTMHSSSIPIAPVKPPDNPIQGTDPPSSTVKEPELTDISNNKCDIPWLSKTVNNNIVSMDTSKTAMRPFAQVNNFCNKIDNFINEKATQNEVQEKNVEVRMDVDHTDKESQQVDLMERTMFSEIVVKDISSNVSNTVIEANFCSTTTESSESGIGTDKSIDSPSDSQTSKECDEDSSLSLSVSVCSVEVQSSQKSPILKQPKTLRFPPRSSIKADNKRKSSTDTTSTVTLCLWENCRREFDSDNELLSHLQSVHVESQAGKENYVCLWEQCKVRGKPSCSSLWLERHTLSHGGNKPFKCIVDGCEKRFSTQILLERHVNNHFNETSPNTGSGKKSTDSATKLIRRNGKKLRYRRQPWSARMFDFFDSGIMEGLAWRLLRCSRWRGAGSCPLTDPGNHTLVLRAAVVAARYQQRGQRQLLLTYYPANIMDDEWVPEESATKIKRIEISELPADKKVLLYEQFCDSYRKTPSPPPLQKKPPAIMSPPLRSMPARQCTSSRLLNNLLTKKNTEVKNNCNATNVPMFFNEEEKMTEVSGAKKRKMGRIYGGNAFWPCGR